MNYHRYFDQDYVERLHARYWRRLPWWRRALGWFFLFVLILGAGVRK